jgi:hypothetical protein
MLKKLYGILNKEEKEYYTRLLILEINSYLEKIYKVMKPKVPLDAVRIRKEQISLIHAYSGALKMWEFKLNPREIAAKGDVGKILVVTRGLEDDIVRKQRALLIASEFYTYHAFANHPDPEYFGSIKSQNQMLDMTRHILGMKNAYDLRSQAVRYIIQEIKEHPLAHFRGRGWYTHISKVSKHDNEMASVLGSSEHTFKQILSKQNKLYSPDMLLTEETLIRKELEEIEHILKLLKEQLKQKSNAEVLQLFLLHQKNMGTFREVLQKILKNFEKWELVDKKEHDELVKRHISTEEAHKLLLAEAEAETIDINKVHLLFKYFKKEKINILMDLENRPKISA